jgi:hypothetical protein
MHSGVMNIAHLYTVILNVGSNFKKSYFSGHKLKMNTSYTIAKRKIRSFLKYLHKCHIALSTLKKWQSVTSRALDRTHGK